MGRNLATHEIMTDTVNRDFLAGFSRLPWELPGRITDVQKGLLESSLRLNILLYGVSFES